MTYLVRAHRAVGVPVADGGIPAGAVDLGVVIVGERAALQPLLAGFRSITANTSSTICGPAIDGSSISTAPAGAPAAPG